MSHVHAITATRTPHAHHPALQHHFETLEQQHEAATLGHVDVPGHRSHVLRRPVHGLQLYRVWYPEAWARGQQARLDIVLGGINTVVLIGSC